MKRKVNQADSLLQGAIEFLNLNGAVNGRYNGNKVISIKDWLEEVKKEKSEKKLQNLMKWGHSVAWMMPNRNNNSQQSLKHVQIEMS